MAPTSPCGQPSYARSPPPPPRCLDSPDSKRIAVASGKGVLVLNALTLAKEADIAAAHGGNAVNCVVFAGSADMVATVGDDGVARVWHLASGTLTNAFDPNAFVKCVPAFAPRRGRLDSLSMSIAVVPAVGKDIAEKNMSLQRR